MERVSTEWGIEFFKEVEDFEKEMKRSAKMRGFKNNVGSLMKRKRKEVFLKVCRKRRGLG